MPSYVGINTVTEWKIVGDPNPSHPRKDVREGWAEDAKLMRERGEDELVLPYTPTKFVEEEWTW